MGKTDFFFAKYSRIQGKMSFLILKKSGQATRIVRITLLEINEIINVYHD